MSAFKSFIGFFDVDGNVNVVISLFVRAAFAGRQGSLTRVENRRNE